MKILLKNAIKKIRKSFGRFLSIVIIIALGISFFIGLFESTTGMLYTADNYYDKNNLMDFKVTSTYGLTEDDIESINNLENTYKVIPSYSLDVVSGGKSIRLHAILNDVNNVTLVKGRMPKNNGECLADYSNYEIGSIIKFDKYDTDNINISSCNVVGTIKSVLYIREDKGISNVGNGTLESFAFVLKDVFTFKYYTEAYILANGSKEMNSYYKEYTEKVKYLKEELEKLKPIRETIRYELVLKEANDKIIAIRNESYVSINKATDELSSIKEELDTAQNKIIINKKEINKTLNTLKENRKTIINELNSRNIQEEELDNKIDSLKQNINTLKEQIKYVEINSDEYISLNNSINILEDNYNGLLELKNNLNVIDSNINNLNSKLLILKENEEKLNNNYNDYYKGTRELEVKKEEIELKIIEAKEELEKIEKPKWYLLDRFDNSGYINYKEDIIKVSSIATYLPIFFVLIVILICSNTLSRMIEEERMEIGILKSNGCNNKEIISGYLLYVIAAGTLGVVLGFSIGYALIPKLIYSVFLARYYVPELITVVSPLPFSTVIVVTYLLLLFVTIQSCFNSLKEVPAELLRPKPPKEGKKVFLEKTKLWNKLSFMWKITMRNLFRYKKRVIMTLLGVSGCTALLLAGLGINDSINTISKIQYNDIIKYDSMYTLNKNITKLSDKIINVFNKNEIVNPLLINQNTYTFSYDNKVSDVYLIVPEYNNVFNNYVSLKDVITNRSIMLQDKGVIITKQMADYLKVKEGSTISIRNSDNELFLLYVDKIIYNYTSHYIYMSSNYYKEIFGSDVTYNTIIANGKANKDITWTVYDVLTVTYTKDIIKTFDSFISGLNKIIILIVACACLLAFVVLYNLTIINISERQREISSLKVLGFYDNETSKFVYRETIILTIIGGLLGLILGVFLHRFIIMKAQTDGIVFLLNIKWYSFIISYIITLIFSYFVQLIINRSLKKIDMVLSLKSVE